MKNTAQIFLCYCRQDEAQVKELYRKLSKDGFNPWMDSIDLVGGERWQVAIQRAIRGSQFFIACISTHSLNKRGFLQREIRLALDALQELLDDDIYIIPVRLEDCAIPESLSLFQWVDYFRHDGWERLSKAIKTGMKRLGVNPPMRIRSNNFQYNEMKEVKEMLQRNDFFENSLHWMGKGITHEYELIEKSGCKVVWDRTTDLVWQQSGSDHKMPFHEAWPYVNKLNEQKFAGYDDWRLPTLEEAMSLMDKEITWQAFLNEPPKQRDSKLHINNIFDHEQTCIWTTDRMSLYKVWYVYFTTGRCNYSHAAPSRLFYVRAVRSDDGHTGEFMFG